MTEGPTGLLATSDGEIFEGQSIGVDGVVTGEAVFNTSMTGYQEILTDPSYAGQVVVMTSPHIGNYGVNEFDQQSASPALSGFVVRSMSRRESNWRSEGTLSAYFANNQVVALSEIDTRRLTRHLRTEGSMPVAMGAGMTEGELKEAAAAAPRMEGQDLVSLVTTTEPYRLEAEGERLGNVHAIDLGLKKDILRNLTRRGFDVEVVPAGTPATAILEAGPDGVFVSNGPGDPEPLLATTETLKGLIGKVPIFGICLGHQVMGLAAGASTFKLPFGHHGGNHPVRRYSDGGIEITSQNHGFAVDLWPMTGDRPPARDPIVGPDLLPESVDTEFGELRPTHQNLNDGTLEGMALVDASAYSVQYHPESAPGPSDARALFDDFVTLIEEGV
jgi:carbamoyl-phosphate synthase small subunit